MPGNFNNGSLVSNPEKGSGSASNPAISIGVVIPTYRRPEGLLKCLEGLARQERLPDDVIVTMRDIDTESKKVLGELGVLPFPIRVVLLTEPGLVPACNAALDACRTAILAFLDDDAVPHRDWCLLLIRHFSDDPRLGGVGGKDRLYDGPRLVEGQAAIVGKVFWFGRVLPNHHLGYGEPRPVDMLKGTNMGFRSAAFTGIRFDTRLRGSGIQAGHDLAFSQAIKHAGWELLYDPAILVDHYTDARGQARHYVDVTRVTDEQGFRDWSFNEVVALWDNMPLWRRIIFAGWSLLVGTRVCPGLLQAVRFTPRLGGASWQRFILAQKGKLEAFRSLPWRNTSTGHPRFRPISKRA